MIVTTRILSSLTCRSVNDMYIFNSALRRKRSCGHRHDTSPIFDDVSPIDLPPFMQKPLGLYHIRLELFHYPDRNSIPCTTHVWKTSLLFRIQLNTILQQSSWILSVTDFSNLLTLRNEIDKRSFLILSLFNKGLLDHKSVKYKIPLYFKE